MIIFLHLLFKIMNRLHLAKEIDTLLYNRKCRCFKQKASRCKKLSATSPADCYFIFHCAKYDLLFAEEQKYLVLGKNENDFIDNLRLLFLYGDHKVTR